MSHYPLGCAVSIVVYYGGVFIQSHFSELILKLSELALQVSCDNQSDLVSAIPELASWP